MSLLSRASKVSFWFNAKLSKRVRHTEEKRRKRKERPFGHCVIEIETHWVKGWSRVCSSIEWAKLQGDIKSFEVQSVWRNREKHSESVREWKKRDIFLCSSYTRKINWWSPRGVFECYNHGELEYSEENFATNFVVILYLLIEIYLLYIQFIVDSSLA